MYIPLVPLILTVLAVFLLAIGQDPSKRYGIVAGVLVALAIIAGFATQPALLASLGR